MICLVDEVGIEPTVFAQGGGIYSPPDAHAIASTHPNIKPFLA